LVSYDPTIDNEEGTISVSGAAVLGASIINRAGEGGFFSASGTFTASGSATTIALLKVGMFMVSAQSSTGTVYDSCVGYAYTTSNANKVSSNSNTAIIAFNTSNIQISNAASNLNWVVTYFPSP
jgi:hypothetical protein